MGALALGACAEQKETGFSSGAKEFNDNASFQRGTATVGEVCSAKVDCFSLQCEFGICIQECGAASCPRGTLCADAIALPGTSCSSQQECDADPSCQGSNCTCGGLGQCYLDVAPFCLQLCPDDSCLAPTTTCGYDVTGVRVCYPNAFLGGEVTEPPPPTAVVGDPCAMGTECDAAGLVCNTENFSAATCTTDCSATACPDGSTCLIIDENLGLALCFDDCTDDMACSASGNSCEVFDGGRICF